MGAIRRLGTWTKYSEQTTEYLPSQSVRLRKPGITTLDQLLLIHARIQVATQLTAGHAWVT